MSKQSSTSKKLKKQKLPDVTAVQAVTACDTLIAFIAPMYKDAQREADIFAIASFKEFLSQLTGFRSMVQEVLQDDSSAQSSSDVNIIGS